MAQLIIRSLWIRPFCQQCSVQLWKSSVPYRTAFTGCGRITRPSHGEVSLLLSSASKKQWVQTVSLFRTASPLSTKTDDSTKFTLIYKFPAIRYCKVVSRLKIMQTTMTLLILPPIYYYYLQGQLSQFTVVYCTGAALFAGAMLYGLSYYLRRIIGMLYVDDDLTTLKVSYLTFWGKRRNILVPIDDVKRFSETGDTKGEILRQFARYSNPNILYFTTRYGLVLDREKFKAVFGE
ncbi:transmembrane protein 186-like isoform 1-T2 [Anomaloglossus baeobatrachus]|uniref:transmembrane protein 186-like n=1 Tax=Anomaloglossus baeobatrachus TaxID=238106 RepID=UPI003F4F79A8